MSTIDWAKGVDTSIPSAARMYDWYLGGAHNFDVDREFGRKVERIWPQIKPVARNNRGFLQRVVRAAIGAGITQFLDLGSGVPTVGNVHEIALRYAKPGQAKVAYIDNEPVAVATSRSLLQQQGHADWAIVEQADLREPESIVDSPEVNRVLDFDRPVCLLMVAILHFVGDEDKPAELVAKFRDRLASGSWFAVSHIACDEAPADQQDQVRRFCEAYKDTSNPLHLRNKAEFSALFNGFDILSPGVVFLPDWRPEWRQRPDDPARPLAWCAVGQKP